MAFKIVISSEYKEHKSGKYRLKRVRSGSFFLGEIREYKTTPGGPRLRIFWSARLSGEQHRSDGVWFFDRAAVGKIALEGVCLTHVGIMVTHDSKRSISDHSKVEEMWITRYSTFRENFKDGKISFDHFRKLKLEVDDRIKLKSISVGKSKSEKTLSDLVGNISQE